MRPSRISTATASSLSVGDVDADGRDEIVYQAMVVDDDGTGLYSTGLRHGDAMHLGDLDPGRPGLEVFTVQENEGRTVRFRTPGAALRDARSGEILWSHSAGVDVGEGLAADIDPRYPGCECWGGPGGLRDVKGRTIRPAPRSTTWAIWWDGDRLRELLNGSRITKWNWISGEEEALFRAKTARRLRNPCLVGDLLGDWREELLVPDPDGKSLRLYTTTIPTEHSPPDAVSRPSVPSRSRVAERRLQQAGASRFLPRRRRGEEEASRPLMSLRRVGLNQREQLPWSRSALRSGLRCRST